ncbi:tyrosine-protein phosphatase corkscrew-like isoform X1 [Trichoplusia ni]|uniref:protein-tyrosine-phosphatase n=1 Tax=Trichoplusia ni TaxID=7111 RepID=A0A7E5WNV0_TRINI|nr:tyrosine-protein phosphatase corkscrew-like isoform X1 [Trichoplusia ni]XP_026742027.1 tyrosine-protein phosphatase corkscrew-like isoform X1 [Trichoplusia ni]
MSKDNPRLSRLGVLAPAALSACMDASVLAVPAAGAIVSTVLKELSKAFMLKKWFHGVMSAKEAEHLIMEKGKNGSFLVRESQAHPGEFVLSVRVRGRVSHVMIRRQHNKYDVGSGEQFDDLVGLIEHFRSYPMIETSGDVLRLLQPVSGTRLRAHDIDRKVQEMQEMEDYQKLDHKSGFDGEFQSLKMLEDRHVFTSHEGTRPENTPKNRYRNILPYDQTRVVLRRRDNRQDSDYINASYIRSSRLSDSSSSVQSSNESLDSVKSLIINSDTKKTPPLVTKSLSDEALREAKKSFKLDKINGNLCRDVTVKNKAYIAAQGCLSNTKDDFWRMIWQEDVRVIAMITNEVENGKKKCERYWPLSGHEERFDGLTVKSISETHYEEYLLREFDVCDDKNCRVVFQYQFTAWPDHGTPGDPDGVLSFIDDINRRMIQNSQDTDAPEQNILCVHCSAGVGRTGTFIVLDMLLDKIKTSGFNCDIDVHSTVKLVRAQRNGMVQNKMQYRFIYLALQEFIDSRNLKLRKKMQVNINILCGATDRLSSASQLVKIPIS